METALGCEMAGPRVILGTVFGEPIAGCAVGSHDVPPARRALCFAGVSVFPMPQLPHLLCPRSCQLGRSAMRLVTLQQCRKCPPASPVTPRREERPVRWELVFCWLPSSGDSCPLHPWGPHFWDALAGVGTMLDHGASPSSPLSVSKSHTKIHLQIWNTATGV